MILGGGVLMALFSLLKYILSGQSEISGMIISIKHWRKIDPSNN